MTNLKLQSTAGALYQPVPTGSRSLGKQAPKSVCISIVGGILVHKAGHGGSWPVFHGRHGYEVSFFMVDELIQLFAGPDEVYIFRPDPM